MDRAGGPGQLRAAVRGVGLLLGLSVIVAAVAAAIAVILTLVMV